jgi:hypothetical protein
MPTTNPGGASQNVDPALAKDNISARTPITEKPVSPRDALLSDIDARIEEARSQDDEYVLQTGDTRAIMMAAEMRKEARGEQIRTDQPRDADGRYTADAGAGGDPYPEGNPDIENEPAAPARVQADPLEDFVVREAGKQPMFKTIVDGKVVLIPLDRARQQLQKNMAADARLQAATERQKQLDARERGIALREQQARQAPAPTPEDDAALDTQARDLVRSLLSDPEATAAGKMADVLKKIRAATPRVDVNALTRQAVDVAKQEIAAEGTQKALVSGLSEFNKAYPDIAADPRLYAIADRETETIAQEHPEWTPAQVMLEAGKKTRDWFGGRSRTTTPNPADPASKRQQLKQRLTPMPPARSARPAATQDANADDSPQSAMEQIRKARGQAY